MSLPFQNRVGVWLKECFGIEIANSKIERNHRFLEESLELVQACGCSKAEALQLVDYVYDRPPGEIQQEVGGVIVTLNALACAQGVDTLYAGEVELERCWVKIHKIREKQKNKPKFGPLPEVNKQKQRYLPVITEEMRQDFCGEIFLIDNDTNGKPQWTQEAVNFACMLNAAPTLPARPDQEALDAAPMLKDKRALVLYFNNDEDRDGMIEACKLALPNARTVKI